MAHGEGRPDGDGSEVMTVLKLPEINWSGKPTYRSYVASTLGRATALQESHRPATLKSVLT